MGITKREPHMKNSWARLVVPNTTSSYSWSDRPQRWSFIPHPSLHHLHRIEIIAVAIISAMSIEPISAYFTCSTHHSPYATPSIPIFSSFLCLTIAKCRTCGAVALNISQHKPIVMNCAYAQNQINNFGCWTSSSLGRNIQRYIEFQRTFATLDGLS